MPEKMKIKKSYDELLEEWRTIISDARPSFEVWVTDLVWHLRANTVLHTHLLEDFRGLSADEFRALKLAADLPNSGIHTEWRAPGRVDESTIRKLAGRGLIHCLDNRFWTLTHLGKMLMVESVGELDGIPLR